VNLAGFGGTILSFVEATLVCGRVELAGVGSATAAEVDLVLANTSSARARLSFGAVSTRLPLGLAVFPNWKLDPLSVAIEKSSNDGNLLAKSSAACVLTLIEDESRAAKGSPFDDKGTGLAAVAG